MALVILDFNGTIYDPERDGLIDGAKELLDELKRRHIPIVLVSKQALWRGGVLGDLGIADYFADVAFVDQKTGQQFLDIMQKHEATPDQTFVIGDYLPSEIRAGNDAGAFTIHYRKGKLGEFDAASIVPSATVEKLTDALLFIH